MELYQIKTTFDFMPTIYIKAENRHYALVKLSKLDEFRENFQMGEIIDTNLPEYTYTPENTDFTCLICNAKDIRCNCGELMDDKKWETMAYKLAGKHMRINLFCYIDDESDTDMRHLYVIKHNGDKFRVFAISSTSAINKLAEDKYFRNSIMNREDYMDYEAKCVICKFKDNPQYIALHLNYGVHWLNITWDLVRANLIETEDYKVY